jgi:lipopolysaccharide biosynthesis protein
LAVVVHVFYYDMWTEIADALSDLAEPFDLYCTVVKRDGFDRLATDIQNRFPGAQVLCYPNHGRDIFPFVHLVNSGILFKYAAVCKLHTKKSTHLDRGDEWRKKLIQGLLPGKAATKALLDSFLNEQNIGAWVADKQLLKHRHYWGPNRERVEHELARIGIKANRYELKFPGGSMFWIKPAALHLLKGMDYNALDFEREEGQLDGTLAHAIERIIGFLVQHSGQRIVEQAVLLGTKS